MPVKAITPATKARAPEPSISIHGIKKKGLGQQLDD